MLLRQIYSWGVYKLVKEKVKKFSCLNCGNPFDAYPPDDSHDTASRNEGEYEDKIKVNYICKECKNVNTIYWGHPKIGFAII